LEALEEFPMQANRLKAKTGTAELVKTDIFKRIMYYSISANNGLRNQMIVLSVERAKEIYEMNQAGKIPDEFRGIVETRSEEDEDIDFADVTGQIELKEESKKKRGRGGRRKSGNRRNKDPRNKRGPNTSNKQKGNNK
jgi:hypothetical protein